MNEPIVCITNQIAALDDEQWKPCVERDMHYANALGDSEPDPVRAAQVREAHLSVCTGCLPRHAAVGFLCRGCATRVETAVRAYPRLVAELTGIDRAKQAEVPTRGRPGSQLPIPPVPLMLEELASYRQSFRGNVAHWVSDLREKHDPTTGEVTLVGGAVDALRFARAFRTAERAHPVEEKSHEIQITRCPRCGHRSLVWHPPTRYLGEVVVQCEYRNSDGHACGYTVDQAAYEEVADMEDRPRPITPPNDRALVFARRRADAVEWAREHDLRPSDWTYIGSPNALRGMSTGHRDRHFLDGFDARRDAAVIREHLTIADITSLAAAS